MFDASDRRLYVLRAVIERGGVNAAAGWLGISQPSVTAHVKALERSVGASLFTRQRGRKGVATPAAQVLYRFACDSAARGGTLQSELRSAAQPPTPELSLAVQRSLANHLLPSVLASFLRMNPGIRISMHSEVQESVRALYATGKVDGAILFASARQAGSSRIIGYQKLAFIAAPDHPLAVERRISAAELAEVPFVGGLQGSEFEHLIATALKGVGLETYRVVMHLQDSVAVKHAVMHGVGVACTLAAVVEQELTERRLVNLDTLFPAPRLPVLALLRRGEAQPLARRFVRFLRRSAFTVD